MLRGGAFFVDTVYLVSAIILSVFAMQSIYGRCYDATVEAMSLSDVLYN